jgi:hypothetical protein
MMSPVNRYNPNLKIEGERGRKEIFIMGVAGDSAWRPIQNPKSKIQNPKSPVNEIREKIIKCGGKRLV